MSVLADALEERAVLLHALLFLPCNDSRPSSGCLELRGGPRPAAAQGYHLRNLDRYAFHEGIRLPIVRYQSSIVPGGPMATPTRVIS